MEELANLVVSKVHTDLGIEDEDSSRSYDEGAVDPDDGNHVSKSCKVEKRRLHKQRQCANVSTKLESYEDFEARMESLGKGHFDEDPDHAMTRPAWAAIAQDSAKKAADTRELLRLKKKEVDEIREKAKAIAAPATPLQIMAHEAPVSPIDDVVGALGDGMEEAPPDVPSEVCLYIRKLLTLANDHEMLKGASCSVTPDTNALCQRMANEVHRGVLTGDSHVAATGALKDEFNLRTCATTTAPGLLKRMCVAIACRKIRTQRRPLGLGTAQGQQPKSRARR